MNVPLTACLLLACTRGVWGVCTSGGYLAKGEVECPSWDGELYFLPDPVDCAKYYACTPYGPCHYTCPVDLWWDAELNICNWPDEVECAGSYY